MLTYCASFEVCRRGRECRRPRCRRHRSHPVRLCGLCLSHCRYSRCHVGRTRSADACGWTRRATASCGFRSRLTTRREREIDAEKRSPVRPTAKLEQSTASRGPECTRSPSCSLLVCSTRTAAARCSFADESERVCVEASADRDYSIDRGSTPPWMPISARAGSHRARVRSQMGLEDTCCQRSASGYCRVCVC